MLGTKVLGTENATKNKGSTMITPASNCLPGFSFNNIYDLWGTLGDVELRFLEQKYLEQEVQPRIRVLP